MSVMGQREPGENYKIDFQRFERAIPRIDTEPGFFITRGIGPVTSDWSGNSLRSKLEGRWCGLRG